MKVSTKLAKTAKIADKLIKAQTNAAIAIHPELNLEVSAHKIVCEHSYGKYFMLFWKASDNCSVREQLTASKVKGDPDFRVAGDYRNPQNWDCDFYTLKVTTATTDKLLARNVATVILTD